MQEKQSHRPLTTLLLAGLLGGMVWLFFSWETNRADLTAAAKAARLRPTGQPQLISIEPLPSPEGQIEGQIGRASCRERVYVLV